MNSTLDLNNLWDTFLGIVLDFLRMVLTFDGVLGKSIAILFLVLIIGLVCEWAKNNFTTEDDPFRFMEEV